MITLKEQSQAAVPWLHFLVGEKRVRARQIAEFDGATNKVVSERDSLTEEVTVWHVLGFGRTKELAKAMAAATVGPDFFCAEDMGSSARFERENQIAA